MIWELSPGTHLRNDRVRLEDADRQQRTAAEILRRLNDQPGLVLADEVGMGKTYVALAVAVSVLEATRRRRPVVVMVPPAVADKWPTEWAVFAERCLPHGHGLRASGAVRRGSEFLKLLDDGPATRKHLIFLTHGALTTNLNDPFIRLALLRRATQRRPDLTRRRRAIARAAQPLLNDRRFADTDLVMALFDTPERQWRAAWQKHRPDQPLDDDPVPEAFMRVLGKLDLAPLRAALQSVPVHHNTSFQSACGSLDASSPLSSIRPGPRASGSWTTCTYRSWCSTRRITSRTRTSSLDCSTPSTPRRTSRLSRAPSATSSTGCSS